MFRLDKKQFVYVNSANRSGGTSTSFSIPLSLDLTANYDTVVVTQANIPISYYLIPTGFNTFQLKENSTIVTITIPAGNYNINSFCSVVAALLTTASPNTLTYTMTYNNGFTTNLNGLITYTQTNGSIASSFIFSSANFVNEQAGFARGSTAAFSGTTLVSTNVVNFVNETTIFIHSDIYTGSGSDDVLQEIYQANGQSMAYINYLATDPMMYSKRLSRSKSQTATFTITDNYNTPINLNGQDYEMTIMFYRAEPIFNIVRNMLQMTIKNNIENEQTE